MTSSWAITIDACRANFCVRTGAAILSIRGGCAGGSERRAEELTRVSVDDLRTLIDLLGKRWGLMVH